MIVGIIGLYAYALDPLNAWLGWFGIKEEYRNSGYGFKAIKLFEEMVKTLEYKYIRLFTDKYNNDKVHNFYKNCGFTSEDYINDLDPASKIYPLEIFSKGIDDINCPKWNNRNIHFTEQVDKQQY